MSTMNGYNEIGNRGWFKEPIKREVEKIVIQVTVTQGTEIPDEMIKREFSNELAKELFQRDLIVVQKNMNAMTPFEDHFSAMVKVVPPESDITNVIEYGNNFEVEGVSFTKDKVEHALKETFPEYFI